MQHTRVLVVRPGEFVRVCLLCVCAEYNPHNRGIRSFCSLHITLACNARYILLLCSISWSSPRDFMYVPVLCAAEVRA